MEEKINQNVARIKELTGELIVIYENNAGEREKENVDRIHSEIKIRSILDKLYTKRELSEANLIALHNYIFEFNNNKSNYNCIYDLFEKHMLFNSYEIYKDEINELIKQKNNSNNQEKFFGKIRKKIINSYRR